MQRPRRARAAADSGEGPAPLRRASLRRVEPEWLDALPPSDPRALRSRRDLGRINAIMRHGALLRRLLVTRLPTPPARLVELGGGDGRLLLSIARGLGATGRSVAAIIVDPRAAVTPATHEAFAALGWRLEIAREDAESYLARTAAAADANADAVADANVDTIADAGHDRHVGRDADAVVANLFLHHLDDAALRRLLALAAAGGAQLFAACEPRRSRAAAVASRLLWVIGCNDVSRHDAVVSVRAGFAGRELSELWPEGPWQLDERRTGPFSHVFAAWRTDHAPPQAEAPRGASGSRPRRAEGRP